MLKNCTWVIQVTDSDKVVEIKFSTFDIEYEASCSVSKLDQSQKKLIRLLEKFQGNQYKIMSKANMKKHVCLTASISIIYLKLGMFKIFGYSRKLYMAGF